MNNSSLILLKYPPIHLVEFHKGCEATSQVFLLGTPVHASKRGNVPGYHKEVFLCICHRAWSW